MTEAVQNVDAVVHRYKRGDVRHDGKIFWQYDCKQKEIWLIQKKFLDRKQKDKKRSGDYKKNNADKIKEQSKAYREKNKEAIKTKDSAYYQKTKDVQKIKSRERYVKNRPYIYKRNREWVKNNKDKNKSYQKKYYNKNKSKINKRQSSYHNKRMSEDVIYRFSHLIKNMVRNSLNKKGYSKKSRTHEILGCSFEFFKNYIEQRFQEGMTWENRSKWHLDHIVPVSFGKTEKEIIKLNHYTNLRPLWAEQNLVKWKHQNKQLELIK
jgi:hypothetical protein